MHCRRTGHNEEGRPQAAQVQRHQRVGRGQAHVQLGRLPLAQHVQPHAVARVLLADQVVEADALARPARATPYVKRLQFIIDVVSPPCVWLDR